MEQSDGLSNGYARNERKFTADQIVHFKFTYHPKNCKQSTFLNSMLEYTSNYTPPSFHQQKHFFKQFENQISRRPAYKSTGEVDPYSPDVAPMNIFEKQVVPTGIHNLSKIF